MPVRDQSHAQGSRRLFLGGGIVAAIVLVGVTVWPLVTTNRLGTPQGANAPENASDRGAQKAAESTVGKEDPAGQEDSTGGRARAIKQSSRSLQLNPGQREQLKGVISRQAEAPRVSDRPPFEVMIGAAVPKQVALKDLPAEIPQILNGYWGDQYVLVYNELIIVDQHSGRVVAIVPDVA